MHKAADIRDADVGISVPLGIAINIFGNKNQIPLANGQSFTEIYIGSLPFFDKSQPCLSSVTVPSAKMITVKDVL
jgi:hypothetical protein